MKWMILDRNERGTTVTLFMAEDSFEFLDEYKMREILDKYFSFLPFEFILRMLIKKREER